MKLVKETSKKPQAASRPAFNRILITGLMASSFLVGCNSMGQKQDESPESTTAPEATASAPISSTESETETESKEENADALMSTLATPVEESIEEPVEKTIEPKPVVKAKVAVEKTVVKADVAPVAKVKPMAKIVAEAPKEKAVKIAPKATVKVVTAKKATKSKKTLNSKPLKISLNDLPANYDIWQFKQGVAELEKGVVVSTPTWEMGKEGYNSQIWVTIMENQILINSSSDIDQSAGELGIKINDDELIPFTRIADNNIGVLEGKWLDQLQEGGTMDIFLGFFPGKIPQSDVFKTDVSLDSLSRVVPTYRNLLK